ncbi:MAG: DUF5906 domain-containing protein [Cyclobacteriaceae bacterium]
MKANTPYLRIGIQYYKIINQPLSKDTIRRIVPWNKDAIIIDELDAKASQSEIRDFLKTIPKFDGFCIRPNHLEYQREIDGFYNSYEPFNHKSKPGQCDLTIQFLKHIFNEQIDYGLDYLKLILEKPEQILPILCLVSKDRETGKTTFLDWLKAIYCDNMTINSNQDFESTFNSDWATKLIIGIDETFLEKKEIGEKLKHLSTAKRFKLEAKNKDKKETEFFGKFIMCSNNENSFIRIDKEETRYWVRKVPSIPSDSKTDNFLSKLIKEIPAFLQFLIDRPLSTKCKTRMWFDAKELETDALKSLKYRSKGLLELELENVIKEYIEGFELDAAKLSSYDLISMLKGSSIRGINRHQIETILRENWGLESKNSSYPYYSWIDNGNGDMYKHSSTRKRRFYTIPIELFQEIGSNKNEKNGQANYDASKMAVDTVDSRKKVVK